MRELFKCACRATFKSEGMYERHMQAKPLYCRRSYKTAAARAEARSRRAQLVPMKSLTLRFTASMRTVLGAEAASRSCTINRVVNDALRHYYANKEVGKEA